MSRHEQGGFGTFREGLSMEQFISYLLSYLSQSRRELGHRSHVDTITGHAHRLEPNEAS